MTYTDQLRDVRWQRRALELKDAANWRCEHCGAKESTDALRPFTLHVHHVHYIKGRMAWEYANPYLVVLCEECHRCRHEAEERLRAALAVATRKTHHKRLLAAGTRLIEEAMKEVCDA